MLIVQVFALIGKPAEGRRGPRGEEITCVTANSAATACDPEPWRARIEDELVLLSIAADEQSSIVLRILVVSHVVRQVVRSVDFRCSCRLSGDHGMWMRSFSIGAWLQVVAGQFVDWVFPPQGYLHHFGLSTI